MKEPIDIQTNQITIGVVGLGLMGCSIATCFLLAGHPVVAIAPIENDLLHAEFTQQMITERSGLLKAIYDNDRTAQKLIGMIW